METMETIETMEKTSPITLTTVILVFIAICLVITVIVKIVSFYKKTFEVRHTKADTAYVSKNAAAQSTSSGTYRKVNGMEARLDAERQNRFMPGRNAYETARSAGNFRSVIFRDANGIQKLLDEHAGTGEFVAPKKEKVNFNVTIGQYMDPITKGKKETYVGIIHYGLDGAYIVPARPGSVELR